MKNLFGRKKAAISLALSLSLLAGSAAPVTAYGAEGIKAEGASENAQAISALESVTDIKEYGTNELLVLYKAEGAEVEEMPKSAREEELTSLCSLIEVDTKKELRQAISALEEDKEVGYIQPNYAYRALYTDDAYSSKQWAYYGEHNIGMEEAWVKGTGINQEVIVAVIDVGVDYDHEDLRDSMWVNPGEKKGDGIDNDGNGYIDDIYGWNFFDGNGEICDYEDLESNEEYVDDHGTHIAGIIAATADNGVGVAGIASRNNVKIMSAKVMGDKHDGNGVVGYSSAIIEAIVYAEENGASICNMSLGYEVYDQALYAAMKASNMLFVCAAGNGSKATGGRGWDIDISPEYPASFDLDNIISVANMNSTGVIDRTSCYGRENVDMAAPGTEIASTGVDSPYYENIPGYMMMTGTSMAAPMVSGAAALVASYYGALTTEEIKEALLEGAKANSAFGDKVASQRMLSVIGALSYYENRIMVATSIDGVSSKSNNKRVTARIKSEANPVTLVSYEKGNLAADYFAGGAKGISLYYDGEKVSFTATSSGTYTIYILCEDGTEMVRTVSIDVPTVTKVKLSATKKTLKKGKTYRLKATIRPLFIYAKIVYETSNSKIATVSAKGKVTAKRKGKAKIIVTAKDGNTSKKAVCTVTVTN